MTHATKVRTKFNYSRDDASLATALICDATKGKTQQNFKEECDINTIIRRFNLTGQLPDNLRLPQYIDYQGVFDFQSAMQVMMEAEEQFMSIPAELRAKFDNSPQKFLEFCTNSDNLPALREMGLAKPEPIKQPPAKPADPPIGDQPST